MADAITNWLHSVFVAQFDAWILLGFFAQGCFTMRFVVQWIASERAKRSVVAARTNRPRRSRSGSLR